MRHGRDSSCYGGSSSSCCGGNNGCHRGSSSDDDSHCGSSSSCYERKNGCYGGSNSTQRREQRAGPKLLSRTQQANRHCRDCNTGAESKKKGHYNCWDEWIEDCEPDKRKRRNSCCGSSWNDAAQDSGGGEWSLTQVGHAIEAATETNDVLACNAAVARTGVAVGAAFLAAYAPAALLKAAEHGHRNVALWLLARGADAARLDNACRTAEEVAKHNNHHDLADLIWVFKASFSSVFFLS